MTIEEVFRKLRPILGRQLDALWQEYLVAGTDTRQTIERMLRVLLAQRLAEGFESEQVLLKPPPRELAAGEYPVGEIHYGQDHFYSFGLREPEFIQHIGVFGRSGSGKTNLAYLLLEGLVRANKPFLVFDWKRNYRDLIRGPAFSDLLVFTVGRAVAPFRFNPLVPPPGTPATVWLKKLIEIMCHAYFLGEGVSVLLMRAIDHLYTQAGVYSPEPRGFPVMADVRDHLLASKTKGRESGWMESAMRAVETLCFGEMGRVLNEGPFVDLARLFERRIILELDPLTNADKTFLIESLLLWIHHYRLGQPTRETFSHAIVVEEAHHILLRKKQEITGEEAVTDILLREIRELGEAVIVLDQHPSLISKPALGNTYTTFAFNLKHRGDIAMIQDCLHLDSEQAGYLNRLEVGWAVAKLQGRWFFPFLIKLPLVRVSKGSVSDREIGERANRLGDESGLLAPWHGRSGVVPAQRSGSAARVAEDKAAVSVPAAGKEAQSEPEQGRFQEEPDLQLFMRDIHDFPSSPVRDRIQRLGISARRSGALQSTLLSLCLISFSWISLPTGRIKALALTEKGRSALGLEPGQPDRLGGPEHRYWVKRIAERLRAEGWTVTEEYPLGGGKTVDLVAERDGKRVAYEIETGKSDASANVRKCLGAGFARIVVVATTDVVREKLTCGRGLDVESSS